MLSETQISQFLNQGFLNVGQVYDDEDADVLKDRLKDIMEGRNTHEPEALRNLQGESLDDKEVVIQVVNIWEADDLYRGHLYHPAICKMASELTGSRTLRVWHDQIQYKPPVN